MSANEETDLLQSLTATVSDEGEESRKPADGEWAPCLFVIFRALTPTSPMSRHGLKQIKTIFI